MSVRVALSGLITLTAAGLGVLGYGATHSSAHKAAPPPTVNIIVTDHTIPAGTLLRDVDFKSRLVPASEVSADTLRSSPDSLSDLRGALLRRYLEAGHPITADDFLRPRDRGFLAAVMMPGMRAISIGVDAVSGVGGLIWPGDHVDVLLVQDLQEAPLSRRVAGETVMSNVRVVAVDQRIAQGASGDQAGQIARTVSLEVTPEEAERAAVAQHLGRLALTIRSADPAPQGARADSVTVFSGDVSPALASTQAPNGVRVRVIEGDTLKDVIFR
jgi:pilus assembly protein CpaB